MSSRCLDDPHTVRDLMRRGDALVQDSSRRWTLLHAEVAVTDECARIMSSGNHGCTPIGGRIVPNDDALPTFEGCLSQTWVWRDPSAGRERGGGAGCREQPADA